mmetsp:Transcript_20274/g.64750  ORF Transcript_20274/g.64750 Transcript_20274/m.64750 type:complete len:481 (-) Transcript_20274:1056-2498(-)
MPTGSCPADTRPRSESTASSAAASPEDRPSSSTSLLARPPSWREMRPRIAAAAVPVAPLMATSSACRSASVRCSGAPGGARLRASSSSTRARISSALGPVAAGEPCVASSPTARSRCSTSDCVSAPPRSLRCASIEISSLAADDTSFTSSRSFSAAFAYGSVTDPATASCVACACASITACACSRSHSRAAGPVAGGCSGRSMPNLSATAFSSASSAASCLASARRCASSALCASSARACASSSRASASSRSTSAPSSSAACPVAARASSRAVSRAMSSDAGGSSRSSSGASGSSDGDPEKSAFCSEASAASTVRCACASSFSAAAVSAPSRASSAALCLSSASSQLSSPQDMPVSARSSICSSSLRSFRKSDGASATPASRAAASPPVAPVVPYTRRSARRTASSLPWIRSCSTSASRSCSCICAMARFCSSSATTASVSSTCVWWRSVSTSSLSGFSASSHAAYLCARVAISFCAISM